MSITREYPGWGTVKEGETGAVALGLMQLHQANTHPVEPKQGPPKMDRPHIDRGSIEEERATFLQRWDMFKGGTATMSVAETCCQLLTCCEPDLEVSLFQTVPDIATKWETAALEAMKALAVIDIAATVRVTELLSMKQEHGEGMRAYLVRVRGKANIWTLTKCQCGMTVS